MYVGAIEMLNSSDVKPKLKIPMGTAVFAQNFPG